MTPERLQEIRDSTAVHEDRCRRWGIEVAGTPLAENRELLDHIDAQAVEIEQLRRGQGRAPAPAAAGPVPVALHEAHPIPDSTRKD